MRKHRALQPHSGRARLVGSWRPQEMALHPGRSTRRANSLLAEAAGGPSADSDSLELKKQAPHRVPTHCELRGIPFRLAGTANGTGLVEKWIQLWIEVQPYVLSRISSNYRQTKGQIATHGANKNWRKIPNPTLYTYEKEVSPRDCLYNCTEHTSQRYIQYILNNKVHQILKK